MATFLQILGGIFLGLILLFVAILVLGYIVIRKKMRQIVRNAEDIVGQSMAPPRATLMKMAAHQWADEESVMALVEPLAGLGFEPAGLFEVAEIEELSLAAWVNAREGVTAVVYEHESTGVWMDLVTCYQDGTRVTYANKTQGGGVKNPPGHLVKRFDGIGAVELYQRFLPGRFEKPWIVPSVETFAADFQKAYADEMDWRNSQGGPTEAEVRAVAALSGERYDDGVIAATVEAEHVRAMDGLREAIEENFLAETTMSAARWETVRDRLFVVHDKMRPDYLLGEIEDWVDGEYLPDDDSFNGKPPRRAFRDLNQKIPKDGQFEFLGSVSGPVEADIYATPDY